ncbi:MAG TPA: hypothetical protein VEY71_05210, partial [Chitinophagales bacterium]|nr:hypothetical protein [Chitinophagales bacterium]
AASSGVVRYDKTTGQKTFYTNFNTPALSDSGSSSYETGTMAVTVDDLHRVYASNRNRVARFNGSSWSPLFTVPGGWITDLKYTTDNAVYIASVVFLTGSYYNYYRYDIALDTLQAIGGNDYLNIFNGEAFFMQDDGTRWAAVNLAGGNLVLRHFAFPWVQLENIPLSPYNPATDTTFIVRAVYSDDEDNVYFITNEIDSTNRLGVLDSDSNFLYYDLPVNLPPLLNKTRFVADSLGNKYFLFYTDPATTFVYDQNYNNYGSLSQTYLMKFDGNALTVYDENDIGSPYFNFQDMELDAQQNLWLSMGTVHDRTVTPDLYMKTPSDTWSSVELHEAHLPGFEPYEGKPTVAYDGLGNVFMVFTNALSVMDSNRQAQTFQLEDSVKHIYGPFVSASRNGEAWVAYKHRKPGNRGFVFAHYNQGAITKYVNPAFIYDSTDVTNIFATDDKLFVQMQSDLYQFDGTTWTLLPSTGNYPQWLVGYDYVNDHFWYRISGLQYIRYDGVANTTHAPSVTPSNVNNIVITPNGDKYFLAENTFTPFNGDKILYKWGVNDSISSCPLNPAFFINYTHQVTDLLLGSTDDAVYMRGRHNPTNGEHYVLRYDGENWSHYNLHPVLVDWFDDYLGYSGPMAHVPAVDHYYGINRNNLVSYQPSGLINLPNFQYNVIHGVAYFDINENGALDSLDITAAGMPISAGIYSTLVNADGSYELHVDTGFHSFGVVSEYDFEPAQRSYNFLDSTGVQLFNQDFAAQPDSVSDLAVTLTPTINFRPGFVSNYHVGYTNTNVTVSDATVKVWLDPQLDFISANPTPTAVSSDTLIWELGTLPFMQTGGITVSVETPASVPIGSPLASTAWILPIANDEHPGNNVSPAEHVVTGAIDPNDKQLENSNANNTASNTDSLVYLIRFQNTGTDTAFNVTVRDTL